VTKQVVGKKAFICDYCGQSPAPVNLFHYDLRVCHTCAERQTVYSLLEHKFGHEQARSMLLFPER
jgi:hypothetical protein